MDITTPRSPRPALRCCLTVAATAALPIGMGLATAAPAAADASGIEGVGGSYYLTNSLEPQGIAVDYGRAGDTAYIGDFTGDGVDSIALRRGNITYLTGSSTAPQTIHSFAFGRASDTVVIGDWDGDGWDSFAVRRGNGYHVRNGLSSGPADFTVHYGTAADEVLVGDWNGDGLDTLGVRRGNVYYLSNSLNATEADIVLAYGRPSDTVLVGDWDGDGKDSLGVRRGTDFHLTNSLAGGPADTVASFGRVDDVPFVGDWDGDGRDTVGVRRPDPIPEPAPAPAPANPYAVTGVWAQLAQCESGGNPRTNTGNGYYGLYQFSLSTWRSVGGSGLPSNASPEEQTMRAQILQARSGWGQWPACSRKLGLR